MASNLDFYTYKNTYNYNEICNNYIISADPNKGSYEYCENYAFINNSPFFILANGDDTTLQSDCYIYNNQKSDSSINNWINTLTRTPDCEPEAETTPCWDFSGDHYYAKHNYFSIYANPSIDNNIPLQTIDVSLTKIFTQQLSKLTTDIASLKNNFITYKYGWYDNVSINSNNQIYIPSTDIIRDQEKFYSDMNKIKNDIYYLETILANLESVLQHNNIKYNNDFTRVRILNDQLIIATNKFNTIMGEDSGALGLLKDNTYNTNLILTQDIIIFITIIIILFVYFKYINN